MNEDDKRLISWALRAYAVQCENSPMLKYTPDGCSRDAKRARELADSFYPYSWQGVVYSTSSDSVLKKSMSLDKEGKKCSTNTTP